MNRRFVGVKAVSVIVAGLLLGLLLVVEKPIRSTFHSEAPRLLVSALCLAAACVLFVVLLRYVTEWIALGRLPVAERHPAVVPQERTIGVVTGELKRAAEELQEGGSPRYLEEVACRAEALSSELLKLVKRRKNDKAS